MNWNLASFQGRKLLLIIVNQNNFVPEVGKARPGHQPNVSRSHNCNMHPLLRISSENKFDNYFISFPAELPPITDAGDRMVMDHTGRPISAQHSLPPAVQVAGKPAIRAAILQIGADHL